MSWWTENSQKYHLSSEINRSVVSHLVVITSSIEPISLNYDTLIVYNDPQASLFSLSAILFYKWNKHEQQIVWPCSLQIRYSWKAGPLCSVTVEQERNKSALSLRQSSWTPLTLPGQIRVMLWSIEWNGKVFLKDVLSFNFSSYSLPFLFSDNLTGTRQSQLSSKQGSYKHSRGQTDRHFIKWPTKLVILWLGLSVTKLMGNARFWPIWNKWTLNSHSGTWSA